MSSISHRSSVAPTTVARKNKLEIDAESHQAVLKLIKSVPTLSAPTATISTTRHSEEFFRMETPPPEIIEPQEVPIFPRNQQPGRIFTRPDLGKPHSIASVEALTKAPYSWLSTVTVKDEEDDDIANEHLKLAGGWGKRSNLLFLTLNEWFNRWIQNPFFSSDFGDAFPG